MPAFQYTAVDSRGNKYKGVAEADHARQLREHLRDKHWIPLTIEPVASHAASKNRQRISTSNLTLVTYQMATLLKAGIPIDEMLAAVAEQNEKSSVKRVILSIRSHILEGYSLSESAALFPKIFSKLYCTTLASGETSGRLDLVLEKLAHYIGRQRKIKQKITQALLYPALMTVVSISIIIFLISYIVPKMVATFNQVNVALPWSTRWLIAMSHFLTSESWALLGAIFLVFFAFKLGLKKRMFRLKFDYLLMRLPLLGPLIKMINEARFASTFSILSSAHVPLIQAIEAANGLVAPLPMHEAIANATTKIHEGISIASALGETHFFSPLFVHLIASGEKSGQLDTMLEHAATTQEDEVNTFIENMLVLFEPILILVMGSVVLFIVLAIMLPIFQMDQFTG